MGRLIRIREYVIGVDEVGLGALAGPIYVCGVAAPSDWRILGLADSKQLSDTSRRSLRARLWEQVIRRKIACALSVWPAHAIDEMGISAAHRASITDVVNRLVSIVKDKKGVVTDIVIDGSLNFSRLHPRVRSVVKADSKFATVSAASIIAKVQRDDYMIGLGGANDVYGYKQHKGYPTPFHLDVLRAIGASEDHRRSYRPVADAIAAHQNGGADG